MKGYHGFDNSLYHCWAKDASANNPSPLGSCSGETRRDVRGVFSRASARKRLPKFRVAGIRNLGDRSSAPTLLNKPQMRPNVTSGEARCDVMVINVQHVMKYGIVIVIYKYSHRLYLSPSYFIVTNFCT